MLFLTHLFLFYVELILFACCLHPSALNTDFYETILILPSFLFHAASGWIGLMSPCVLYGHNVERRRDGRNVERLRAGVHCSRPCMWHAFCVEGGIRLAAAVALFYGYNPYISALLCEGLLFSWGICVICTGNSRLSLQWKYHLEVSSSNAVTFICWLMPSQFSSLFKDKTATHPALPFCCKLTSIERFVVA